MRCSFDHGHLRKANQLVSMTKRFAACPNVALDFRSESWPMPTKPISNPHTVFINPENGHTIAECRSVGCVHIIIYACIGLNRELQSYFKCPDSGYVF